MKIGLLGGTFNPIHNGHLKLALEARRQFGLSRVYMVLSPRSPFKINSPIAPLKDRLSMLKLALREKKSLIPGPWELKDSGPSYTVRTLEKVAQAHPTADIYFIMGSDTWKGFSQWKNPGKILNLSTILIGRRPGAKKVKIPSRHKYRVKVLEKVFPDISSTQMRTMKRHPQMKPFLSPRVFRYIRKNGLYEN